MLTNHTVTAAPESARVELDAVTAQYVADVLGALARLDHHLRGVALPGRETLQCRAHAQSRGDTRQMVAAAIAYGCTEEEAQ